MVSNARTFTILCNNHGFLLLCRVSNCIPAANIILKLVLIYLFLSILNLSKP